MKKKILIITGTPMRNDTNIGKTLKAFFSNFDDFELHQLYFSPESPNLNICKSYYQICEKELLKNRLGLFNDSCGNIIKKEDVNLFLKKPEMNNYFLKKRKNNIGIKIGRELIWNISHWKNKRLKNWIDEIKPDVIFTIMQDVNAITQFITTVSSCHKIPVIMFVTDDYFNDFIISKNPVRKLYYFRRKKLNSQLAKNIKYLIGCSDKATHYFKEQLKIKNYCTFYTPSNPEYWQLKNQQKKENDIIQIRYFGNLGIGRDKILREIGKALQKLNSDGMKAKLEIYSSVTDKEIIQSLNVVNGSEFKGWTYGKEYIDLLQKSDIVVHVESFDVEMIKRTWVSVSTKISDYLGAGKCILVVGPPNLASIEHLQNAACVVTDISKLLPALSKVIEDKEYRKQLEIKSRSLSKIEHNAEIINQQLKDVINYVITK